MILQKQGYKMAKRCIMCMFCLLKLLNKCQPIPIACATYTNMQSCRTFLLYLFDLVHKWDFSKSLDLLRNKVIFIEVVIFKNDGY